MAKSIWVCYILYIIAGCFSFHHLYLRRYRQAFAYLATFGGFGFGLVRDLWRIPSYVAEANNEQHFVEEMQVIMRRSPQFNFARWAGSFILAYTFSFLFIACIPDNGSQDYYYIFVLLPFFSALGSHLVANIGMQQGSMKAALAGAYIGGALTGFNPSGLGMPAFCASLAVEFIGKRWKPLKKSRPTCCRTTLSLLLFGLLCAVYFLLWGGVMYYNVSVTTADGQTVPLSVAADNFFKSKAWADTKQELTKLWNTLLKDGIHKAWSQLKTVIDPEGEEFSRQVLGVSNSATDEQITAAYKKLVREWHPDKVKDPMLKNEAHEKFMEIQKAYDTLSNIQARRIRRHQKSPSYSDEL